MIQPEVPGTAAVSKFCECRAKAIIDAKIKKYVPKMWHGLRVADLKVSEGIKLIIPTYEQRDIIDSLKQFPLKGHFFLGPSGMGKSRFLHCLFQEALYAGRDVYFSKMSALIRLIRDNEFKRLPEEKWEELVNVDDIRERSESNPLHIFLDEVDKVPFTDDVYLKIFELIDFIYENQEKAVLSLCSNLSEDDLIKVWGEGLSRRLAAITIKHSFEWSS